MIKKLNRNLIDFQSTSVYDFNELTLQDLLSKFFDKINNCIDVSNQALSFLEWLKEEGLPIEVQKEIEKMYLDGRLTEIINKLADNVNEKVDNVLLYQTEKPLSDYNKVWIEDVTEEVLGDLPYVEKEIDRVTNKLQEIDTKITTELNEVSSQLEQITTYTLEQFGAKNYDEITRFDSTKAFRDAINSLKEGDVLLANGNYLINNLNVTIPNNCKIEFNGTVVSNGDFCLKIKTKETVIKINNVKRINNLNTGLGIILEDCYNSEFKINTIKGFDVGLRLQGTQGEGCQYCKINFLIFENINNIQLFYSSELTGWVNENTFTGGRLIGTNGVEYIEGAKEYHNNKFYNVGCEWLKGFGFKLRGSVSTSIYSPRFENVEGLWIDQNETCKSDLFVITSWLIYAKCKMNGIKNDFAGYEAKYLLQKQTQGVSNTLIDLGTSVGTVVVQSDTSIATINLKSELHQFEGFRQTIRVAWFVNEVNFTLDGQPLTTIGTINKEGLYELKYNQKWYLVKYEGTPINYLNNVILGSEIQFMGNRLRCAVKRDDGLKVINLTLESTNDFGNDKTLFTLPDELIPRLNGNKIGMDFNAIGRNSSGVIYPCIVAVGSNGVGSIKTNSALRNININVSYY